jgi:hypothetical protein
MLQNLSLGAIYSALLLRFAHKNDTFGLSKSSTTLVGNIIFTLERDHGDVVISYHLRRLRLHGMIERAPQSHRYRLTDIGLRTGWFFTRTYALILRRGLGRILPELSVPNGPLRRCFDKLDHEVKSSVNEAKLAA